MKRKLIKILSCAILGFILAFPIKTIVSANQRSETTIEYVVENKQKLGNILIYSSHSCETYIDGYSVVDGARELSQKLNKLGFKVTHLEDDFANYNGYNESYYSSRNKLNRMDLSKYDLIIDYHRDFSTTPNTIDMYGNESAKGMIVLSKSGDYKNNKKISNKILDNLHSKDIFKDTYEYERGINYFNQDIKNSILLEMGNNENTYLEVRRLNTWVSKSLYEIFKNNLY